MPSRPDSPGPHRTRALRALAVLLCIGLLGAALVDPVALTLPPVGVLQAIFHHFMYPLLTGERWARPVPYANNLYILLVVPALVTAIVVLGRRLVAATPPGTYIWRAAKGLGLMVLAIVILNVGVQGGLGIPLALAYAGLLLVLWWQAQQLDWTRKIVAGVVWVGLGFLVASGALVPLAHGETRFDLQRLHGIYGYLWSSVLGAYLIGHIAHYEAKRETSSRNWGYLAAAILAAAVLTGIARLHGGGETVASGLWPHVGTGVAAGVAMAVHIGRSWRQRGLSAPPGSGYGSGTFVLGCLCLGLVLPALPIAFGRGRDVAALPTVVGSDALAASRQAGVTASGPRGAGLPVQAVSIRDAAIGCGKTGGCHVDTQAQWERSAHRFSANAAYRQTVRLLIEEEGIERARACAACHDPVPLLSGQIVAGSTYPRDDSEGVTCVVCHSMRPGVEGKNGHYLVEPSATFHGAVQDPFTSYMMVELYRTEHRADFLAPALTDNSMCAPCHNLTTEHLVLRRTYDEWRAGPFGPDSATGTPCSGCHMPMIGDSYLGFFKLHDHRMPAANVALAGLRGESPETERAFIAAALDLQISVRRRPPRGFEVAARLANQNGGHVFPTAPRDLLDYWFEVQFEGDGVAPTWHRLDAAGLFPETLIAGDGRPLSRHEIWRAVGREGPEGIPPGEAHEYTYPLPDPPPAVARVSVRLMHRRYRDAFLGFLAGAEGGLYTGALEVLRRTIDWNPESGRTASRSRAHAG